MGGESIDDTHTSLRGMLRRFGLTTERRVGDTTTARRRVGSGFAGTRTPSPCCRRCAGWAVLGEYLRVDDELQRLADRHRVDPEHPEAADGAAASTG